MALAGLAGLANAFLAGAPEGFMRAQQQQDQLAQNALLNRIRTKQLADAQREDQARATLFSALSSPEGLAGLSAIGSSSPPGFTSAPAPPQGGTAGASYGGGSASGGGAPTSLLPPGMSIPRSGPLTSAQADAVLPIIKQDESRGRNIMQTAYSGAPGAINPSTGTHTPPSSAQGYEQITDSTWRANAPKFGVDLKQYPTAMSAPEAVQDKVARGMLTTTGVGDWAPWNKRLASHLGLSADDPAVKHVGQQATQTAQTAASSIPEMVWGRMSLQALARQIDKANPDADPVVKMMALEQANKLLAPSEQRQWQLMLQMHREDAQQQLTLLRESLIGNRQAEQPAGQPFQDPDTKQWYQVERSGGVRPIALPGSAVRPSTTGTAKPGVNVRVVGDDGKTLYEGAAIQDGGAYKKPDGTPIPAGNVTLLGRQSEGAGRQAETQNTRMTVAANEARRQLQNISQMARGSTTSWFQGIQSQTGHGLVEGLTRSLANQLTPTDQQIMSTLGLGLGRSLASLETAGAATGLVGLTKTMEGLIPAAGDDTVGTTLTKLAEMRQIAEQAIQTSLTTKGVQTNPAQRQLLEDTKADIERAIPFTVPEVLNMIQNPNEETYATFAKSMGLGGGQGGGAVRIDSDGNVVK